jgi:LysR family glycine cleavage system transcriptional activator
MIVDMPRPRTPGPDEKREGATASLTPPTRKSLPPFETLRAFDAVARLGGVRKAAQSLCRDHAVVSRHLRAIEAWTGATLIERTSAGVVLTEGGVRYHRQIATALDLIAHATLDLMRHGDYRRLNIRCISGFALHWLSRRLGEFEKAHPELDIELRPTDRTSDLVGTHETDVEIRFIASYATPTVLSEELRSVDIVIVPLVAVANPAYLAESPPIREPRDLLNHKLLHEENFVRWSSWLASHGVHDDVDLTGPRLWAGHLTLDAARYGRGIALTNHLIAADDLMSGALLDVGKGNASFEPQATGTYHLVTRADRWDAPLIRQFRQWLTAAIAAEKPRLQALNRA